MKHAKLGASSAHRWRPCPGSINLSEGIEDTTSIYAAEGTVAHSLGEEILRGVGHLPTRAEVGTIINEGGFSIEVTEELLDAVYVFVDFVTEQAKDGTLLLEQQFDLDVLNPPGPMYGTADAVVWTPGPRHLHVIDYKHGQGVSVDVVGNDQGLQYALGAAVEFIRLGNPHPEKLTFTIVQPRAYHDDGPIRSWDFTWAELAWRKKELFSDAEATLDPNAPLHAGDWCRFCKAKPICPEQRKLVEDLAVEAFDAKPTFPEAAGLSPADLAEVLEKSPAVTDWIKSVQSYALNMLQRGEEIPGFKLVEKRANRRWVDEKKTETYLKGRKLKVHERNILKLISPAQAEKLLKNDPGPDLPDRFWEKPEGGAALAPLSDKRPEKVAGVEEAFGILPETTSKLGESK